MAERSTSFSFLHSTGSLFRLLFWLIAAGILVFLVARWVFVPSMEDKRLEALESLQDERNSKALTLIHRKETITIFGIPVESYIDINDAETILRVLRKVPPEKKIDLIMHTPGGLVLAASQIAQTLQDHQGKVTVFIPHYAMSGGTLIALAADEIVMAPNAVLGPVDPQIGNLPAASIIEAVEQKPVKEVQDKTLIYEDISIKAIDQVKNLVISLVEPRLGSEKSREIARMLSTGKFTHAYPITVEHARRMGISVSTDMPESVYTLMDLYPQGRTGRPSVNYIPMKEPEKRTTH